MKNEILTGKIIYNERGFGFVELDKSAEDIFIPPNLMGDCMNGDTVKVEVYKIATNGNRAEGKIIEIIKRNTKEVIGIFRRNKNYGFIIPDDNKLGTDIYISKSNYNRAKNGDKVVAKIIKYPENKKSAEGKIIEILGKANDPNIDLISVIKNHNYSISFPKEVEKEAKLLPEVIHKIDDRIDLRNDEIFTIDGDDTKDIDDAISLRKKGKNYVLGVHIADVSYYVREGTAIDKEAIKRGTSVYLINTVLPMLPRKLSNGICSLNPGEDRYTLSVEMEIDQNGNVIDKKIFKSVINSKIQMTYDKVFNILENNATYEDYIPHINTLKNMRKLAEILINKKNKDGAIDFDMPEAKIILDDNSSVVDVKLREITIANKIIETFMIVANETIAQTFFEKGIPFIYRIHEKPDIDKIDKFNVFLKNMDYPEIDKINNKAIKKIFDLSKGKNEEKLISLLLLRTMQLAKYSNENIGHFGLASKFYCHFTSPIRRYPDLFIHRVISDYLANNLDKKKILRYKNQSVKYAEISSEMEQVEEEAERDLYELKKCEYMQKHIGEEFEGIISGVTSFGIFIELNNTIEGLNRIEDMDDDYYIFDEDNLKYIGKHSGKEYGFGNKVRVKCISVSKIAHRIDFKIMCKL